MILIARGAIVVYGQNTTNRVKLLVKSCLNNRCVAHRKTVIVPLLNRRVLVALDVTSSRNFLKESILVHSY